MKSPDSDSRPDPARVEELYHAAAELKDGEQAAFLEHACGADSGLQESVRALLSAGREAPTAWNRGALEVEARRTAVESLRQPGEFFGPYRILRRIAAGGMSMVYEALRDDAEFHKRVAIKFASQAFGDPALTERFRIERQILAQLEHPNIARLLDGGTTADGTPYLVMEYVDGLAIDRFVIARSLSRTDRLKLFLQVCEAVEYAHRNLIVHRDLKPGNILVTPDGVPKLLDFGIAKLLTSEASANTGTMRALTPEYASPEQVLGVNITTASDVYSLGVLLFLLLAGRLPYRADAAHPADLVAAICEEEPVWEPAGLIQGDLESIVAQALRKEPQRRYLSVEQFAADIRRYIDGLPVSARPDTFLYRARKFVVRRAIPIAAVAAILAAVGAGVFSTLAQSRRAERRFNEVRSLAHAFLFDVYDAISSLPGSLAARRLVVTRAQEYLDSLARETGDDPALIRELAESYVRLATVRGAPYAANLGDTAGALDSYRKAKALIEREARRHPSNAALQKELSQLQGSVAAVLVRQKDADGALAAARQSVATAEALCARYPREFSYRLDVSRSYVYLGEALKVAAEQSGSISLYQQELAAYQKSVATPEGARASDMASWEERLGPKYFYLGYALRDLGDRTGDVSYYQQALDASLKGEVLYSARETADPSQISRRNVADGLADIGILRWKCCRDLTGALRDLRDAEARFQVIAGADPQDIEARRDVADASGKIGVVLAEVNHRPQALAADRKALAIYEELARLDPTSRENADYAAAVRARIAAIERGR